MTAKLTNTEGVPKSRDIQYPLNKKQIEDYIPHRDPFLVIDKITNIKNVSFEGNFSNAKAQGTIIFAQKQVTQNEFWVKGHFPQKAVMPGVLIIEAMAQTTTFVLYAYLTDEKRRGFSNEFEVILTRVDDTRFRKPVHPGDLLDIEAELIKVKSNLWIFSCRAMVGGRRVAESKISAILNYRKK